MSSPPLCCSVTLHAFAIVKFATSIKWKTDFADIAAQFETHKDNLAFDLQMHTSITITNVSVTLTSVNEKITAMTAIMEMVFEKMQSSEEKELAEFARRHDGIEKVLESSELKKQLFEEQERKAKKDARPSGIPTTLAEFEQELAKDVRTILEENKKQFDRRFEEFDLSLQEAKVTRRRESDRVIQEVSARMHAGSHEQIIDKVIRIACSRGYVHANCSSIQDLYYIWKGMVRTLNILTSV